MFYLFKHAINNYKISTPKILAKRIYDDAMTLSKDINIRKNLFKISADLGNSDACLQYVISIYKEDHNDRFEYLLKSKDLDLSLWMLSYIIEHHNVTKQQLEQAKTNLKGTIYLKKSISLSNLHAMDNLAIYYKKNNL